MGLLGCDNTTRMKLVIKIVVHLRTEVTPVHFLCVYYRLQRSSHRHLLVVVERGIDAALSTCSDVTPASAIFRSRLVSLLGDRVRQSLELPGWFVKNEHLITCTWNGWNRIMCQLVLLEERLNIDVCLIGTLNCINAVFVRRWLSRKPLSVFLLRLGKYLLDWLSHAGVVESLLVQILIDQEVVRHHLLLLCPVFGNCLLRGVFKHQREGCVVVEA